MSCNSGSYIVLEISSRPYTACSSDFEITRPIILSEWYGMVLHSAREKAWERGWWLASIEALNWPSELKNNKYAQVQAARQAYAPGICARHMRQAFSSPEAALLLVSTKNHDLWPGPTPKVRVVALHMFRVKSDIWLVLVSIYHIYKASQKQDIVACITTWARKQGYGCAGSCAVRFSALMNWDL